MTNEEIVREMKEFKNRFREGVSAVRIVWGHTLELRALEEPSEDETAQIREAFKEAARAAGAFALWLKETGSRWPWANSETLVQQLAIVEATYGEKEFDQDKFTGVETEFVSAADEYAVAFYEGLIEQAA